MYRLGSGGQKSEIKALVGFALQKAVPCPSSSWQLLGSLAPAASPRSLLHHLKFFLSVCMTPSSVMASAMTLFANWSHSEVLGVRT